MDVERACGLYFHISVGGLSIMGTRATFVYAVYEYAHVCVRESGKNENERKREGR